MIESNRSMEEANQYLQSLMGRKWTTSTRVQDREDLSEDRAQISWMMRLRKIGRANAVNHPAALALSASTGCLDMLGGRAHPEALSCERRRAGRKTWAIFKNERHFGGRPAAPCGGQKHLADFCGSWVVKEAITHYQVACDSIRTIRDFEIAGGACSSKRTG